MSTTTKLKLSTYRNKHGHTFKAVELDGVLVTFPQKMRMPIGSLWKRTTKVLPTM